MPRARRASSLLAASLLALLSPASPAANGGGHFASYLGGSGDDEVRAVAAGTGGTLFFAGTTASSDFPVKNARQATSGGGKDAFVVKLAADGQTVLFATYLGGAGDDEALALAPDGNGGVWVGGITASSNFPVAAAWQSDRKGAQDGFLAHLSGDGATLLSSTYIGGTLKDGVAGVAVDSYGYVWIAGSTASADFPTISGAPQIALGGQTDAFVASWSADGLTLRTSTYLGGSGDDFALAAATGGTGAVTVAGSTLSSNFPTSSPIQASSGGAVDAFVLRLNGASGGVLFSTYLGGTGDDEARALSVDGNGGILVAGTTKSGNFPVAGPYQASLSGASDAFAAAIAADGTGLSRSTYLGGSGSETASGIGLDASGDAVVAGETTSSNFPLKAAAQTQPGGAKDAFVARFSGTGAALAYATYRGGSGSDAAAALLVDGAGEAVLAGSTGSSDLGLLSPFQASPGGGLDGFAARVPTSPPVPVNVQSGGITYLHTVLTWADPSGGRATFEIQRRSPPDEWVTVALPAAGTTTWTDTAVVPGTSYYYRMRSVLDGVASPFTSEFFVLTPSIPMPAAPGKPVLEAESAHAIRVRWEDRSDDEIQFEVFRAVDGGEFALAESLVAGTTEWRDEDRAADRTWSYEVRAVGVAGASPFTAATSLTTDATMSLSVVSGKRTDVARASKDSVAIAASFGVPGGGPDVDFVASGIQVGVGGDGSDPVLSIPAGDAGWKSRRGVFTWRSPKGSLSRAVLTINAGKGTLKLKVSRLELDAVDAADLRVWVRCGEEGGSFTSDWTEKKPGKLAFRR